MIKNNLSEIIGKILDQTTRENFLKKGMTPIMEFKRNIDKKQSFEIETLSNCNFDKKIIMKKILNSFENPPNLMDDRSLNHIHLEDIIIEPYLIPDTNKNNESLPKDLKSEDSNTFELDNIDISELIKNHMEYEKEEEKKSINKIVNSNDKFSTTLCTNKMIINDQNSSSKNEALVNSDKYFGQNNQREDIIVDLANNRGHISNISNDLYNNNFEKEILKTSLIDSLHEEDNIDIRDYEINR